MGIDGEFSTHYIFSEKYQAKLTSLYTYVNLECSKSISAYITDFRTMQTNEHLRNTWKVIECLSWLCNISPVIENSLRLNWNAETY